MGPAAARAKLVRPWPQRELECARLGVSVGIGLGVKLAVSIGESLPECARVWVGLAEPATLRERLSVSVRQNSEPAGVALCFAIDGSYVDAFVVDAAHRVVQPFPDAEPDIIAVGEHCRNESPFRRCDADSNCLDSGDALEHNL